MTGNSHRRPAHRSRILTFTAGLLSLALLGTTAACGTDSDTAEAASSSSAADAYYPHTLHTLHSDVTVNSQPKRIVAMSQSIGEMLVSLGITPVAVTEAGQTTDFPWTSPEVSEAATDLRDAQNNVNVEKIAELDPDLVIATPWNVKSDEDFERLNTVAPTIAIPDGANYTWDALLSYIGEAVDRQDEAEKVLTDLRGEFRDAAEKASVPDGATYTFTKFYQRKFTIGQGSALELLGLEPSAATQGKTFYESGVSLENAGDLKAGLIVILATADDIEELKQDRAFAALPGIRDSHVEFLELGTDKDLDLIAAINGPDPASLAWEKDKLAAMAGKATH